MPFTIGYNQEADIIMVVVHGELSLSLLQELAGEVSKIVKKVGCRRILSDLRNAKPTTSTIDIYDMPKTAIKSGITLVCKRALLVVEETKDFHFHSYRSY